MAWIVVKYACGDGVIATNDAGETPTFADFDAALAAIYRHGLTGAGPLELPELLPVRMVLPVPYCEGMEFDVCRREYRELDSARGRREMKRVIRSPVD